MRIIITSDLHYDVARSKAPTEALADEICRLGGDVLLIIGDCASHNLSDLDQVLGLFERFRGVKLAVAGNHELWNYAGDTLDRYENELPPAFSRNGFHLLDHAPARLDGVAFVGSVGWYDYSFRPSRMGIPLRFYQSKIAPGAAAWYEKHRHLVARTDDIHPSAMQVSTRWMDGKNVRLPIADLDFTIRLVNKLRAHLESVHHVAQRVIAAVHHLPFAELVPHSILPNFEFATAFLGSELFGEALLDFPKITHLYCGHSHAERTCRKANLLCKSIGCTYREKTYELLEI